jgi:hypothetical protein
MLVDSNSNPKAIFYENSPSSQTQEANITFALKPPSSGPDWHDRFINAPTGLVK